MRAPSGTARRHRAALVVTLGFAAAACGRVASAPTTTLSPLVPPDQVPIATAGPSTTAATSSLPDTPLVTALPDPAAITCAVTPVSATGTITFVSGDRLWEVRPDGSTVSCIWTLSRGARGPVQWSPDGRHALLNGGAILDEGGARWSGFEIASPRIRWEHTGDTLVAFNASGRSIVPRDAANTSKRSDATFLDRVTAVAPYPRGDRTLLAAGTDGDVRGIFATPERKGGDVRVLATITGAKVDVLDLAVDATGDSAYAVIDRGEAFEVGDLRATDLSYRMLSRVQAPIAQLTVGPVGRTVAWRQGLCNTVTQTWVRDDSTGTAQVVGAGSPLERLSVTPVGWLDAQQLVVTSRSIGCDGLGDVWVWHTDTKTATLLVKTVELATTRTVSKAAGPLAITPGAVPAPI